MSTADCSRALRARVDAATGPRYETLFAVCDLLVQHDDPGPSSARACELRALLTEQLRLLEADAPLAPTPPGTPIPGTSSPATLPGDATDPWANGPSTGSGS